MTFDCGICTKGFVETRVGKHRAFELDQLLPDCQCEVCSIGQGSPGPVTDDEKLFRFVVQPTDIDPETNVVFQTPFQKAAENGLSVFRGSATDSDIAALVTDRLTIKKGRPRPVVLGLFVVVTKSVRMLKMVQHGEKGPSAVRAFGVYDETVPRNDISLPHVPTHVSIYQRLPPKGGDGRNGFIQADNFRLFEVMTLSRIPVESFRDGLLLDLNRRSLAGEFERPEEG